MGFCPFTAVQQNCARFLQYFSAGFVKIRILPNCTVVKYNSQGWYPRWKMLVTPACFVRDLVTLVVTVEDSPEAKILYQAIDSFSCAQ